MPLIRGLSALAVLILPATSRAAEKVDFARDIRPILSNKCFKCHGPATQKSKLRLDDRDAAIKKGAIAPGKHSDSELLARVVLPDSDDRRMPPADVGERLTADQVAKLKAWIEQGAEYPPHWAFVAPKRPEAPSTKYEIRNAIDKFVFARLAKEGLKPSPEADKATLIRRVTLDLTGLLPTPKEVDDFLKDDSPIAYEKVVDRLLASPHYGERQARHWLDLARYADSNGYTIDGAAVDLAVPRLGHQRAQRRPAVRPVHDRATRRRPAARTRPGNRRSPPGSIATRRSTRRAAPTPSSSASSARSTAPTRPRPSGSA